MTQIRDYNELIVAPTKGLGQYARLIKRFLVF
jgi:hypothetical protein